MLEKLSDKFGEADPIVVSYIEQQTAVAAQMRESSLFREFGSAASGELIAGGATGTPGGATETDAKLNAIAKKIQATDPKKTYQKAFAEAMETDEGKALYQKEAAKGLRRGS
jgi:hypothetical protein